MISLYQIPVLADCQIGGVVNWLGVVGEDGQGVLLGAVAVQGGNAFADAIRLRHAGGEIVQDSDLVTTGGIDLYFPPPYPASFGSGMFFLAPSEEATSKVVYSEYSWVEFSNPQLNKHSVDSLNQSGILSFNDICLLNTYENVFGQKRGSLSIYQLDEESVSYINQSSALLELGIIADNSSASVIGNENAVYAYTSSSSQSPLFYRVSVDSSRESISIYGNYTIDDSTGTRVSVAGNKTGSNFCVQYFVNSEARIMYGELAVDGQFLFGDAFPYRAGDNAHNEAAAHKGGTTWLHGTDSAFSAVPSALGFDIFFHTFDNLEVASELVGSVVCPPQTPAMCSTGSTAYLGFIGSDGAANIAVITAASASGDIFWTRHTLQKE